MLVNIYTIYDNMAEECGPIFQAKNDKVACRACDSMIAEAGGNCVSDYQLWCLGSFDTEKRTFDPIDNHNNTCGRLVDYVFGFVNSIGPDVKSVGVDDILSDKELI